MGGRAGPATTLNSLFAEIMILVTFTPDETPARAEQAIGVTAEHYLSPGSDRVQKRVNGLQ